MSARNSLPNKRLRREAKKARRVTTHPHVRQSICRKCNRRREVNMPASYCTDCLWTAAREAGLLDQDMVEAIEELGE